MVRAGKSFLSLSYIVLKGLLGFMGGLIFLGFAAHYYICGHPLSYQVGKRVYSRCMSPDRQYEIIVYESFNYDNGQKKYSFYAASVNAQSKEESIPFAVSYSELHATNSKVEWISKNRVSVTLNSISRDNLPRMRNTPPMFNPKQVNGKVCVDLYLNQAPETDSLQYYLSNSTNNALR